eukprot:TRINITY_DN64152_c0_g1_i1.p1 TRINITY_DN64152_c0_g1~~TRINITY_DN64152_c0_g1_i1.p1  ORF type:complete len:418 (+),score=80.43 TRINITY_DN64152_c0_g1_i1:24-1256(+)
MTTVPSPAPMAAPAGARARSRRWRRCRPSAAVAALALALAPLGAEAQGTLRGAPQVASATDEALQTLPPGAVLRPAPGSNATVWRDGNTCEEHALRDHGVTIVEVWEGMGWTYFLWPLLFFVCAPCVACVMPALNKWYKSEFQPNKPEPTDHENNGLMRLTVVSMTAFSLSTACCMIVAPLVLYPVLEPMHVMELHPEVVFCMPLPVGPSVEFDRFTLIAYALKLLLDCWRLCSPVEDGCATPVAYGLFMCFCLPVFWVFKFLVHFFGLGNLAAGLKDHTQWTFVQAWNLYSVLMVIPNELARDKYSRTTWMWCPVAVLAWSPWVVAFRQFMAAAPAAEFRRVLWVQLLFPDLSTVAVAIASVAMGEMVTEFMVYAAIGCFLDALFVVKQLMNCGGFSEEWGYTSQSDSE